MEDPVRQEVAALQSRLGKKATFEDAVKKLTKLVTIKYPAADREARTAMDTAVSRAATLLQTRYSGESSRGFWSAGATLFEAAARVQAAGEQKAKLQGYLAKAHEFLGEEEAPGTEALSTPQARFLFEGQLSHNPPPMRTPDAHALFSTMFGQLISDDVLVDPAEPISRNDTPPQEDTDTTRTDAQTSPSTTQENPSNLSGSQPTPPAPLNTEVPRISDTASEEPNSEEGSGDGETPGAERQEEGGSGRSVLELPEWAEALRAPNGGLFDQLQGNAPLDRPGIQGAMQRLQEMLHAGNAAVFPGLEEALQASLEEAGQRSKQRPAAAKDEVERLPVMDVDEAKLEHFGKGTQCAVCREDLVIGDKVQQMPCNHLFHPPCLAPWLKENNSCPICRYELRTDDNEYERQKEREKEEEEDRKGAANAVREGQFMYM